MAPISSPGQASNFTSGLTSALACLVPLLAFVYVAGVFWTLDYANRRRMPMNKTQLPIVRRYSPFFYSFLVMTSLVMIALPSWVLLQYSLQLNYPSKRTVIALRLFLFNACWTSTTSAAFTIFMLHPIYSRHPISSIGTQSIWTLMTWSFWVAGAAVLSNAVPQLFDKTFCDNLVYCGHLQAIQIMSLVEVGALTAGLLVLIWLGWRCARDIWHSDAHGDAR
ncbi:hypothetical protein MIND_00279600 [Mycena indigotica]|uniref:Uncharacterized protein n=1 Tax=Mycena indigotica TaxID=2126181 RepID=A0A8H6WHP1_9AGAR|nr:uncharacterized protein MIND_00279600 [Mycena indigotica]KAF7312654.1 hypothetical protein MIND_00279600 [Mycena indigotica]